MPARRCRSGGPKRAAAMLSFGRRPRIPFDDLQSMQNAGPRQVNNGSQRFIKILILRNAELFDSSLLNPSDRIFIPISMHYDSQTVFHRAGTEVAVTNRKLSIPAPAGLFPTVSSSGLLAMLPGAEHPEASAVHPYPDRWRHGTTFSAKVPKGATAPYDLRFIGAKPALPCSAAKQHR